MLGLIVFFTSPVSSLRQITYPKYESLLEWFEPNDNESQHIHNQFSNDQVMK